MTLLTSLSQAITQLLIAGFFLLWSFIWSSRDELNRWGLSFTARTALLTFLRLVALFALYLALTFAWQEELKALGRLSQEALGALQGNPWLAVVAIAAFAEFFVFRSPIVSAVAEVALRFVDRTRARLRLRSLQAAIDVLAFMTPLSELRGAARTAVQELHHEKQRTSLELEIDRAEPDPSSDAQRRALALILLERRTWDEIKRLGLVPYWAIDRRNIPDPVRTIDRFVAFFERLWITADDLDRLIRGELEGHAAALVYYEKMLAESHGASEAERRILLVRALVWMKGPDSAETQRDHIRASIEATKRAVPTPVPAAKPGTGTTLGCLKLVSIELENVRCFRSLTLDFTENDKIRPWTMLLGDNGLGKTTILRSIAMALCDQTSATSLMGRLPGELLRQETNQGRIHVRLRSPDTPTELWAETKLVRGQSGIEVQQSTSSWFPRELLFVCGYGALRSGFGTQSYEGYSTYNAVAGLFDPTLSLQNPELALRRIVRAEEISRVCRQIESVLMRPENSIEFGASGISIKGEWGVFVPMGAIGDGYLATLAWLADLLGWTFLYRPDFIAGSVSAIVLIDEIEKHLHPRWQREIVRELYRQFPDVQFVASTHSPLCAGGLADLPNDAAAMYAFELKDRAVVEEKLDPYRGWTYDQIMTSSAFRLKAVRDVTTEEIVDKLRRAHEAKDPAEVQRIEQELETRSVIAVDDERERHVKAQLVRDLAELQQQVEMAKRGPTP